MFKKRYAFGLMVVGGLIFLGVESSANSQVDLAEGTYEIKVNENGQTYGSDLATKEYGGEPDLILVEADNGKTGYAYKDEFYDTENQPNNPDEAMVYMEMVEKNVKKYGYYKSIPVYEADGKTEIGSFKIGSK